MTILGSVLIFATAGGKLAYIDALFFASGANTQAGLNTVDVNTLTTFAQVCIYIFTMTSNPITIHSSVVVLRLYWFEKHFQDLVKGARAKRATLSKSRAKAQDDSSRAERGVAGKHITLMPNSGSRITNDGILLERKDNDGHESPGSTGTAVPSSDAEERHLESVPVKNGPKRNPTTESNTTQITFASTVTRGDGRNTFPQSPTSGQPPILHHRRRDSNRDEILRIPNPRDAEKGMKPRRLQAGDAPEADEEEDENQPGMRSPPHSLPNTRPNTPPPAINPRAQRNPTITIAEPKKPEQRPKRDAEKNGDNTQPDNKRDTIDELAEDATAFGNVLELFKIRKPRIFQRGDQRHHVDSSDEDEDDPRRAPRARRRTFDVIKGALTSDKAEQAPYLSWTPTLGRNSQFPGLTMEQREELGGIEFRSLRTLAIILFCYFWGFWIFAFVCLLPWIYASSSKQYATVVEDAGVSKTWWGFFTANSAFLDLGLTLTPDSMISFSRSQYTLMMMTFLIIAGNTGFPVLLRAFIWIMAKIVPRNSGLWEELRFLLDHPRRCFTLLFPAGATWSLFWILVGLNLIDLVFFIILDVSLSLACTCVNLTNFVPSAERPRRQ